MKTKQQPGCRIRGVTGLGALVGALIILGAGILLHGQQNVNQNSEAVWDWTPETADGTPIPWTTNIVFQLQATNATITSLSPLYGTNRADLNWVSPLFVPLSLYVRVGHRDGADTFWSDWSTNEVTIRRVGKLRAPSNLEVP